MNSSILVIIVLVIILIILATVYGVFRKSQAGKFLAKKKSKNEQPEDIYPLW
ncbi:MAG: hypothetical protein ISS57_16660 [Anaerolineales bacterium]|nr:hypothetical protein [Chloroflexota bacterium]MBL7164227.1 hypothetical protein [Anaerolineales bacterium]